MGFQNTHSYIYPELLVPMINIMYKNNNPSVAPGFSTTRPLEESLPRLLRLKRGKLELCPNWIKLVF
ncbi:hypothetical protein Lalb_Chr23g0276301 [Lupinus albus]|uniref:Uncharacterized protein n=1 Tax=Lupinus albus TaxID=3870 RepID=A0A6A4NFV8_LUPAL|nr:hypothetical protein Lalb_Chr23g0276301 [Lupinus albus]